MELSTRVVGFPLTLPQRCLLYLLDRGDLREDDPAAQEASQDRIAAAIGVRRAHVSRAMTRMRAEGLLTTGKVHVAREPRRRLAYFLTETGLRKAQSIRKEVEEERLPVVDLEGKESERRLYEVALLLSRRPRLSDLLGSIEDGRLDLRRFQDRQARLKAGKVYDVREASAPAHFRGRAAELERLESFLADPKARGILVVGLPGIGKTAVVSRWVAGLKGRVHVLWRRLRPETAPRDLLHDIARLLEGAGRPALLEYLQRPPEGGTSLPLPLLRRDLAAIPALIVVDDAHVANREVATFLGEIGRIEAPPGALKAVLISRERVGYVSAGDLARDRVWELEVGDLLGPEALAVLEALGAPLPRREEILDRCGGHPLSLELAAAGRLTLEGVRRTSAAWFAEEALSKVPPGARRSLELACVFEGPVSLEALGPEARELVLRCVIREVGSGKAQVHDLVRDAVVRNLPTRRLAALRVRAGRILADGRDPIDGIAAIRQFLFGGAFGLAEELARERGVEIIDAGFSQALLPVLDPRAWSSAKARLPRRLWLLRGEAFFALGRWAEAAKAYQECGSARDPLTAAEARLGQGKAEQQRESVRALPLLLDAGDRLEKLGALRLLAETQYRIGCVHEDGARLEPAQEAFERGRAIAFDVGDRRWEGLCTYGLGRLRSLQTDYAGAVNLEREALRLLERGGYRLDVAKVCAGLGGNLLELQQWSEAETYLARANAEARRTGATGVLAAGLYNLAAIRLKLGDHDGAIPFFSEALEAYQTVEQHQWEAIIAAWLGYCYRKRGEEDVGDRFARLADDHVARISDPALRIRALRHLARTARRVRRMAEGQAYIDRAVSEARKLDLPKLADEIVEEFRNPPSA